jgi:hypothetical protein
MLTETNEKLQQTKNMLVELIAELDMAMEDFQALQGVELAAGDIGNVEEIVGRLMRERKVLMNVASMLAEVQFDWPGRDGEVDFDSSR